MWIGVKVKREMETKRSRGKKEKRKTKRHMNEWGRNKRTKEKKSSNNIVQLPEVFKYRLGWR